MTIEYYKEGTNYLQLEAELVQTHSLAVWLYRDLNDKKASQSAYLYYKFFRPFMLCTKTPRGGTSSSPAVYTVWIRKDILSIWRRLTKLQVSRKVTKKEKIWWMRKLANASKDANKLETALAAIELMLDQE